MSVTGPLTALGFAFFFAGLYRAATAPRLFGQYEEWGLAALGVAMSAAGLALWAKGIE